jgi:hypothetical protein
LEHKHHHHAIYKTSTRHGQKVVEAEAIEREIQSVVKKKSM